MEIFQMAAVLGDDVFFVVDQFTAPNKKDNTPPHIPPRPHVLLNTYPTPHANFHLIVEYIYETVAT
jgi:hypothetical protein